METFETYRPLLFSIAYRMLGSAMEAEDIVQDAFVQYQSVGADNVHSPRAFLTTVVTRLCLNQLNSAHAKRETPLGTSLPEPILTQDDRFSANPASRLADYETISMAFLVLLETLTPAERAVFLLREVFDYDYDEIAEIIGKSETACRQLFSRANKRVIENRPRFKSTPEERRRLLGQFIKAVEVGELDGLVSMLSDDVTFWADGGGKVRGAAIRPVTGAHNVAQFVISSVRFTPTGVAPEFADVNGSPALIMRADNGQAFLVILIEADKGRIREIRVIADPDKLKML
jgi:RNA polymerase sigma-70 factor (ECF subfamily)